MFPACSGLYAPFWESSARGITHGRLTRFNNKFHVAFTSLKEADWIVNLKSFKNHERLWMSLPQLWNSAQLSAERRRHDQQHNSYAAIRGHSGGNIKDILHAWNSCFLEMSWWWLWLNKGLVFGISNQNTFSHHKESFWDPDTHSRNWDLLLWMEKSCHLVKLLSYNSVSRK